MGKYVTQPLKVSLNISQNMSKKTVTENSNTKGHIKSQKEGNQNLSESHRKCV